MRQAHWACRWYCLSIALGLLEWYCLALPLAKQKLLPEGDAQKSRMTLQRTLFG